ncbi:quinone-dependent dihydroorotate dehydrogenase [Coralliovum pocilloporae]|uniref:quinone-dependent dihydroorotate dehydrogenase n=1 Tax=Coralliovum pocilloporae TaxID=3066369 RepID=UPI003307C306
MIGSFSDLARPLLLTMDPEKAHGLAIKGLKVMQATIACRPTDDRRLAVDLFDWSVPNPVGIAAGFDKNAEVPDALLALGFGFAEAGTVTPRPQAGNPQPRLFRLEKDRAVINRMGFNNDGHAAALARLEKRRGRGGVVGINIGANKDADDRVADYVTGIQRFAHLASYFTVNISSPNTPGLRDLQGRIALDNLLARVAEVRDEKKEELGRSVPILVKIAPDIDEVGLDDVTEVVLARGMDGLIVSNTTLDRHGLKDVKKAEEQGGLSGPPVFEKSTIALAKTRQRVGNDFPIIGAGGISSPETAVEKIRAGATLIQLYSSLVFEGMGLVNRIKDGLVAELEQAGADSLDGIRSTKVNEWAAKPLKH